MRISALALFALASFIAACNGPTEDDTVDECEIGGGQCIAISPGGCLNGRVGDSTKFPCAANMICCLPAGDGATPSDLAIKSDLASSPDGATLSDLSQSNDQSTTHDLSQSTDLAGNPCTQSGGSCVALVPNNCPLGHIGDANKYSCGPGLGIECCLKPDGGT